MRNVITLLCTILVAFGAQASVANCDVYPCNGPDSYCAPPPICNSPPCQAPCPPPCDPCAPVCGLECGVSICAIAVAVVAVVAAAAIVLASGEGENVH